MTNKNEFTIQLKGVIIFRLADHNNQKFKTIYELIYKMVLNSLITASANLKIINPLQLNYYQHLIHFYSS